jgi:hypothetical protein
MYQYVPIFPRQSLNGFSHFCPQEDNLSKLEMPNRGHVHVLTLLCNALKGCAVLCSLSLPEVNNEM